MTGPLLLSGSGRRSASDESRNGIRFASLYAGCGGLDLGFRRAGFELAWANEENANALETHNRVFDCEGVLGKLESVAWPHPQSAEVVVGGPPCQGFSVAGKRESSDPRNAEVWRFFDFVEHLRPEAYVMENVKALAVSERWRSLRHGLMARAKELGFKTQLVVLSADEYGVPQRRQRMFLIGVRSRPPVQIPSHAGNRTNVRDALSELPRFGTVGNEQACGARITPARRPVLRKSPYRGALLFNGSGRPLRLDWPAPTLPASMGGNSTPIVDQAELDGASTSWVVAYHRRLAAGRPPVRRVPRSLRRITVEEAAALQGFPQDMPWAGSTAGRYRQIGNSVPPDLGQVVAEAVAAALGGALSVRANAA